MHYIRKNSLRLKNFDYTSQGYYFITTNTHLNQPLFSNDKYATTAITQLKNLQQKFNIKIIIGCVMPDHLHKIICLPKNNKIKISRIMQTYKSLTDRKINQTNKIYTKLWHRGFYDHIIRNEKDFIEKFNYILYNPVKTNLVKNSKDYKYFFFNIN